MYGGDDDDEKRQDIPTGFEYANGRGLVLTYRLLYLLERSYVREAWLSESLQALECGSG